MAKHYASGGKMRQQAAIDFIISYGFVILLMTIAIYVVMRVGILNTRLAPNSCYPSPSFLCTSYGIFKNGTFHMVLTQATGGVMKITAIACSSTENSTGGFPAYGNVHVTNATQFYPAPIPNGITIYSDNSSTVSMYCYNSGGLATSSQDDVFSGDIWINYTVSGLPGHYITKVATFTTKYV